MKRGVLIGVAIVALAVACGGGAKQTGRVQPPPERERVTEPEPTPQDQETVPAPEPGIALTTIYFDFDRYDIRPDQRGPLAENARTLETRTDWSRVTIEGHCDERGTNEYNMALGQRRADSVKNYLVNYGIPKAKLSTVSYGEERPVDPGHNEEAWARNRRAEFVVQK